MALSSTIVFIYILYNRTSLFPILAQQTAVYYCFGLFAIVSILGEVFIYREVKETRKLSKIQINQLYVKYALPGNAVNPTLLSSECTAASMRSVSVVSQ